MLSCMCIGTFFFRRFAERPVQFLPHTPVPVSVYGFLSEAKLISTHVARPGGLLLLKLTWQLPLLLNCDGSLSLSSMVRADTMRAAIAWTRLRVVWGGGQTASLISKLGCPGVVTEVLGVK